MSWLSSSYKDRFNISQISKKNTSYFAGNSLGPQPRNVNIYFERELDIWKNKGVEGHFEGEISWFNYHKHFKKGLSKLLGCQEDEAVVMATLTENIHILFLNFYKPIGKKSKVLIEKNAFSSDLYAVEAQIAIRGLSAKENLITWEPNENGYYLLDTLEEIINKKGEEIAIIWLGAVNYFNGQYFDIKAISNMCKKQKILLGLDLAHAIGNVPLYLHEWEVDFATWCSYKYLNSGPGAVSGIYIHEKRLLENESVLKGWWGVKEEKRFNMSDEFEAAIGIDSYQLSNAPIFNMVGLRASLEIYEHIDMERFHQEAIMLSKPYIDYIMSLPKNTAQIITPINENERGCQISVKWINKDKSLISQLSEEGIVADWREPNVMRVAFNPLYITTEDVEKLISTLKKLV